MRITVRGWARDMGRKEIMGHQLVDSKISNDPNQSVYRNEPPLIFKSFPGIQIAWHQNLRFMGDYRMTVELSKSDIVRLFKSVFGSELDANLLERYGFTVSDDLKKAVLRTVKLSDVTLGDLAAMSSESEETQATAEKLVEAENVQPFRRRI